MIIPQEQIFNFQNKILQWYEKNKRELPWRKTRDPYNILISEVMSQQTQIYRVVPKYLAWIDIFPDVEKLAQASTRDVLFYWSGLGYNRRALFLQKAAQKIVSTYGGQFPIIESELKKIPGIGEYTSRALLCFAFDQQIAVVDTNVRKVIAHSFFDGVLPEEKVITFIAHQLLPKGKAYEWNQALMDYSALMMKDKKIPVQKQSRFKDSDRYYRGQILKLLLVSEVLPYTELADNLNISSERLNNILRNLKKDMLVTLKDNTIRFFTN